MIKIDNPYLIRFLAGVITVVVAFSAGGLVGRRGYRATPNRVMPVGRTIPSISKTTVRAPLLSPLDTDLEAASELSEDIPLKDVVITNANTMAEASAMREQLVELAKSDPLAALAVAREQMNPVSERQETVAAILCKWAQTDPERSWEWAQVHAQHDSTELLKEIAKKDAAMAWEFAGQYVADHPEHIEAVYANTIEGIIYNGDYLGALEWVEDQAWPGAGEGPQGTSRYMERILSEWARFSPREAFEWIEALPDDEASSLKPRAYSSVLSAWALSEPSEALDFALDLPENADRADTITMALTEMMNQDLEQAKNWIDEHGGGAAFDWNIYAISTHPRVIRDEPETAIDWAMSIQNPEIREDGMCEIYTEWLVNNTEDAKRFFEENSGFLSAETRQRAEYIAGERIERASKPPPDGGVF